MDYDGDAISDQEWAVAEREDYERQLDSEDEYDYLLEDEGETP